MDFAEVTNIRKNWAISDQKRDKGLTTPEDIKRYDNIPYRDKLSEDMGINENANLLDIYVSKNVTGLQPAIINVHGGAFVYGSKETYQFYCMRLAKSGFTVVNMNYRLAPESSFPAPLEDLNHVLWFIKQHGREYHIDSNNLILVGDSAGGQLVSHYAAIFTNPDFAAKFSFTLPDVGIRALGLNCGLYDTESEMKNNPDGMFITYLGKTYESLSGEEKEMLDIFKYITADFPPSILATARNDFLLEESKVLYQRLQKTGIPSEIQIYGKKEQKEIGHVFHINCRLPEAKDCNDRECEFFKCYITKTSRTD